MPPADYDQVRDEVARASFLRGESIRTATASVRPPWCCARKTRPESGLLGTTRPATSFLPTTPGSSGGVSATGEDICPVAVPGANHAAAEADGGKPAPLRTTASLLAYGAGIRCGYDRNRKVLGPYRMVDPAGDRSPICWGSGNRVWTVSSCAICWATQAALSGAPGQSRRTSPANSCPRRVHQDVFSLHRGLENEEVGDIVRHRIGGRSFVDGLRRLGIRQGCARSNFPTKEIRHHLRLYAGRIERSDRSRAVPVARQVAAEAGRHRQSRRRQRHGLAG